ncbi:MAG: glucuronate isomerase [Bacteroidaceae bacterium]|nr:glucuronate isomerase [Bacteroidaceae bacterium]
MKPFLDDNFLLQTPTAQELYHRHAAPQPIIDYHCHLDPALVAEDHHFRNITELWLSGDHYKWRAMRTNGIPERLITGYASDWEKFEAWAATVPYTLRNPLYHWTHLELKTAFGITKRLNPETAREIYDECNDRLQNDPGCTAQGLMRHYNVEIVCTTDDPIDDLRHHKKHASSQVAVASQAEDVVSKPSVCLLPSFRPDKAMAVEHPEAFRTYVERLGEAADLSIRTFSDFIDALQRRHDFFHAAGCRLSDHGLEEFYAEPYTDTEIDIIFNKVKDGGELDETEIRKFKSVMLYIFAVQDFETGWVQQYHYGPLRNNNSRMMAAVGPDTGFDSIGDCRTAHSMSRFLDLLDREERLAKTIIYNLNPADNEMVATMIGNFQDGSIAGKIQWGSGWWFLDQKDGMERQMNTLSLLGLLSRFVGMLTDSRSFLSYPRHEYFRRTLCNLLGNDIENGLLPFTDYEEKRVRQMVEDICYGNAKEYFKPTPLPLP